MTIRMIFRTIGVACCLLFFAGSLLFANEANVLHVVIPTKDGEAMTIKGDRSQLYGYAKHFTERGYYSYARICYETLIESDPRDVRANLLLGTLYQKYYQQLAKAVTYYKRAERLVPERNIEGKALCHRLSADVYRALAEKSNSLIYFVQAIGEYEKIVRYNPQNMEVMYYLASCRLNTNEYERAIMLFERVISEAPKSEWAKLSNEAIKVARKEIRRNRS